MDQNQIIEIIKANQTLPYEEIKRQAKEAGLSGRDFEGAWRKAKLDSSLDNDARVAQIISEIKALGKLSKTIDQWKDYFKSKGYLDDEVDMAYVMSDAVIKFNSAGAIILLILFVITSVLFVVYFIFVILASKNPGIMLFSSPQLLLIPLVLAIFYLALVGAQFRKLTGVIINLDFKSEKVMELAEWKQNGSMLLKYPSAYITSLFKMDYDGRETYYGEYQYAEGSGKSRQIFIYSFIAQKTRKVFPLVNCFAIWTDRLGIFGKNIHLESKEFNNAYKVYAKNPTDAFYVLNPRVMAIMIEPEIVKCLKSFETVGDYILMAFSKLDLSTPTRFKKPYVRFADYKKIKQEMLKRLDFATDINDTLSREIVDDGKNRSVAKNK